MARLTLPPQQRRASVMAGIVAALVLAAAVVRVQLAEIAAVANAPRQALMLAPRNARALAAVATAVQLAGHQAQAIRLADAALRREPMNVAALRTLGVAREALGDDAGAARAMYLAAPLGWRDAAVQVWLIKNYSQHGWVKDALQRTDALARLDRLPEITFPIFTAALKDERTRRYLVAEMKDRPFWRALFFYKVLELPTDQMPNLSRLVTLLAAAGSPVTADERNVYLAKLVAVGDGPAALAYWRRDQHVPATAPLLWDGGFEHVPARGAIGSPFQWQLSPEGAGVVSVVGAAHGEQLGISSGRDFNGTLAFTTAVLPPGRYRIAATAGGDATGAGLHWVVKCAPSQEELPVDAGRDGAGLAAAVTIPATGNCPAVTLAITMASGDDLGGGQVTVDDVVLRRIG